MAESQPTINGLPPRRIQAVAQELHLDTDKILPHGHFIAKIPIDELTARQGQADGRLVLVTAMTPTPEGIGKTTTTIGLTDALRHLGMRAMFCVREPSLGPGNPFSHSATNSFTGREFRRYNAPGFQCGVTICVL